MSAFTAAAHLLEPIELVRGFIHDEELDTDGIEQRLPMLSGGEQVVARLALDLYRGSFDGPSVHDLARLDSAYRARVVDALRIARAA